MNMNNLIEAKRNTHLYFLLGDCKYAINTDNILEIIKLPSLDYPQKLPNNIVGLLKYNNFVINVVDIRFYLNKKVDKYNTSNEIIIVKTDDTIMGIVIDRVIDILSVDSNFISSVPFVDSKLIIDTIYKYENETIYIVNVYSLENLLQKKNEWCDVSVPELFPNDEQSLALMAKRTSALIEKTNIKYVSSELSLRNKYISFSLNNDMFCIDIDSVLEVLKDATLTKIPGVPDFVEGILNLRGNYITVINLKSFLNIKSKDNSKNKKNPVIIIRSNDMVIALLIDKIDELFDYQQNNIVERSDSYYLGKMIYNGVLYTIINIEKIVSDKKIIITDM